MIQKTHDLSSTAAHLVDELAEQFEGNSSIAAIPLLGALPSSKHSTM